MSSAKRGAVWRADLVDVLARVMPPKGSLIQAPGRSFEPNSAAPTPEAHSADASLVLVGALMGLERAPAPKPQREMVVLSASEPSPTVEGGTVRQVPSPEPEVGAMASIPMWQPREYHWHGEPEVAQRFALERARSEIGVEEADRREMGDIAPPQPPPLTPERRLVSLLQRSLNAELPGDGLDVNELVRRWSRGRLLDAFPLLRRRGWPSLVLWIDRAYELVPFWRDQERLLGRLRQLIGATGLVVRFVDDAGPEEGLLDDRLRSASPYDAALAGLPVLALTDLGWYRSARLRRAWLRVGRRLRHAGERLHALVPVPEPRWTSPLARTWAPLPWERPAPEDAEAINPDARAERVARLLDLAACTNQLEPGLLRALRWLLPRAEADVGTEADAWLHPDMAGPFPTASVVRGRRAAHRRARVLMDAGLTARVQQTMHQWHWHREVGPELWHAEVLMLEHAREGSVPEVQRRRAERFAAELGRHALALRKGGDHASLDGLRRWLEYVGGRASEDLWSSQTSSGEGLQLAWWVTHGDDAPPPRVDPRLRALARGEHGRTTTHALWQVGCELGLRPGPGQAGSRIASFEAAGSKVYLLEGPRARCVALDGGGRIELSSMTRLELRTDRSTLVLEPLIQPEWATAIGRDRYGLWAELGEGGVGYRMRWIAPGRFVMGSPEDEPGRASREGPQHEVVITRGFWLGETPVTQALWQAVTGKNPSRFKSPDRPVERVSWDDCQEQFITRLNEVWSEEHGDRFRLPTEEEWEYACRGGTTTATYAGPLEIRGEHNAPVLDDIAWYGGNSGVGFDLENGANATHWKEKQHEFEKAGTRRVGLKAPNPWGLYDMLGNVWEWCQNGLQGYSSDQEQESLEPNAAGWRRYIRGGSWLVLAGFVRVEYRCLWLPSDRYDDLGVRLARDQAGDWTGGPVRQGDPEDPESGRGAVGASERGAPRPPAPRPRRTVR